MSKQRHKPSFTRPAEVPTHDEIEKLMRACSRRSAVGIRNRALIAVLWRAGLRCAEALAIRPSDIDFKDGSVRVLHGKGDKARTVGVDDWALSVIDQWLEIRKGMGIGPLSPVFCTKKGGPIATAYVRAMLPRMAVKAGVSRRIHAHGLRHAYAAFMHGKSVGVGYISGQLGHTRIATTEIYLGNIAPESRIRAVRRVRWPEVRLEKPALRKKQK